MSDLDWQPADENQDLRPHLPECFAADCICDPTEHSAGFCTHCIYDRLRACEARVFVDRTDHWNAALDAAREAVAVVPGVGSHTPGMGNTLGRKHALAAIDALEKP